MRKIPIFSDFLWIILICIIAVLSFHLYFFGRYDAFPWEKRVAQNIELAAYDGEENYKSSNHDYCIPDPKLQVCSKEYPLPGEPCFVQRCRWGHVTELDLTGRYRYSGHLKELPPEIKTLAGLETLNLSGSELTSLPAEIGELRALEILILSGNQLTNLPPEIGKLHNLTVLDLKGNQLTSLPIEVGQLRKLTSLYLEQNPLSGPLPKFITSLPLEYFEITEYQCIPVDKDFQEWIRGILSRNPNPFSQDDLCSLVEEVQSAILALYETPGRPADWSLQASPCTWDGVRCDLEGHVIELFLINEDLTRLPPEIGQLSHLQVLYILYGRLTELPSETSMLTELEWLTVDSNPLSGSLPIFLTKLSYVQFSFAETDYCIPNDPIILDWLREQFRGYYQNGEFTPVQANPEAEVGLYLENLGCK